MRGKVDFFNFVVHVYRITPAYAGKRYEIDGQKANQ